MAAGAGGETGFKITDELRKLLGALEPVEPGKCIYVNYRHDPEEGQAELVVRWVTSGR